MYSFTAEIIEQALVTTKKDWRLTVDDWPSITAGCLSITLTCLTEGGVDKDHRQQPAERAMENIAQGVSPGSPDRLLPSPRGATERASARGFSVAPAGGLLRTVGLPRARCASPWALFRRLLRRLTQVRAQPSNGPRKPCQETKIKAPWQHKAAEPQPKELIGKTSPM